MEASRPPTSPRSSRRAIVRDALGIAVASGAYAVSFGAISTAAGLSLVQTCSLSVLMFTGASQFALVGVVGAGGGIWTGAATAVLLGSRNALYGLRLSSLLNVGGWRRVPAAQFVIDETTAMAIARDEPAQARFAFWATGLALFALWNLGTLIGALATHAIPNPKALGLDAAPPAAFLALLAPRLRAREPMAIALASAVAALVLLPFVPAGVPPLVIALLVALYRIDAGSVIWPGLVAASLACYGLKLAGLSLPQSWLADPRIQRTVPLIPVALLAALVAIQTFSTGRHLVLDVRAASLVVAIIAVALRAPFLVVVIGGAATAALLRLL